ncbi:MAG: hypothetical protein K8S99_13260 [Planctomycetes bacterium]|nr:hypothetical protein [Planctomycetota bacterium]
MPSLSHPYTDLSDGHWLPGTLHAHGDRTGGTRSNQEVLDDYARRGYGFVMIAEHDVYTTAQDYTRLDGRGMVLLPGCELTRGPHMLHVGPGRDLIAMQSDTQAVLDAAGADGTLTVAAHPSWGDDSDHIPVSRMLGWRGLTGLEVYNGLIRKLTGSAYAVDKWDRLLTEGRRVWGFADDDSFAPPDVHAGWNVAWVRKRGVDEVIDALRCGRFYASSGVELTAIRVEGMTIHVETRNARTIDVMGTGGKRLYSAADRAIEFTVPVGEKYVRIEAAAGPDEWAWLQPFIVEL